MDLEEIRSEFGPAGVRDFSVVYGRRGAITDDTQMTLFSAEGLIRAWVRGGGWQVADLTAVMRHAYLRWLQTQGQTPRPGWREVARDGWLFGLTGLHSARAPGITCCEALSEGWDAPEVADNDSKGCGAVMRAAPFGLFAPLGGAEAAFDAAARCGALTHGHRSGFLSAGHMAATVAGLREGMGLRATLAQADAILARQAGHEETTAALAAAYRLAARGAPSPEDVETLGGGWVGEEALAIAVCCALTAEDFAEGVLRAVNHSGDSDSTGAITGNLLGALWGEAAIPARWLAELELRDEVGRVAEDLCATEVEALGERYPGW